MFCLFDSMSINEVKQEILVFPPVISVIKTAGSGGARKPPSVSKLVFVNKMPFTDGYFEKEIFRTRNGESGNGNGERGTENGERVQTMKHLLPVTVSTRKGLQFCSRFC